MIRIRDELKEELLITQAFITANGKIQIIKKEIVKKDIGRSPDKADAVAFCFHNNRVHGSTAGMGTDNEAERDQRGFNSGGSSRGPGAGSTQERTSVISFQLLGMRV